MPVYEYRCRTCDSRFETRRPVGDGWSPIECPDGHPDTTRLLSVFASADRRANGPAPTGSGCGPGCACAG